MTRSPDPSPSAGDDLDLGNTRPFRAGAGAERAVGEINHRCFVAGVAVDRDGVRIGHGGPTRAGNVVERQRSGAGGDRRGLIHNVQGNGHRPTPGSAGGRLHHPRKQKTGRQKRTESQAAPDHDNRGQAHSRSRMRALSPARDDLPPQRSRCLPSSAASIASRATSSRFLARLGRPHRHRPVPDVAGVLVGWYQPTTASPCACRNGARRTALTQPKCLAPGGVAPECQRAWCPHNRLEHCSTAISAS